MLEHYMEEKAILEQRCQNYSEYTNTYHCVEKICKQYRLEI